MVDNPAQLSYPSPAGMRSRPGVQLLQPNPTKMKRRVGYDHGLRQAETCRKVADGPRHRSRPHHPDRDYIALLQNRAPYIEAGAGRQAGIVRDRCLDWAAGRHVKPVKPGCCEAGKGRAIGQAKPCGLELMDRIFVEMRPGVGPRSNPLPARAPEMSSLDPGAPCVGQGERFVQQDSRQDRPSTHGSQLCLPSATSATQVVNPTAIAGGRR